MTTPTPSRIGTVSSQHGNTMGVLKTLDVDFNGAVYQDLSVPASPEAVWGLDIMKIRTITDAGLTLPEDSLQEYRRILSTERKHAHFLYQPFLLEGIYRHFMKEDPKLSTYFREGKGAVILKTKADTTQSDVDRKGKPDLLEMYIPLLKYRSPADPTPRWSEVPAAVEFKRKEIRRLEDIPEEWATSINNVQSVDSGTSKEIQQSPPVSHRGTLSEPARSALWKPASLTPAGPRKRVDAKRQRTPFSPRRFVVDGLYLSLWYYDRSVAMCCAPFDFTTPGGVVNPGLALFAFNQCTMKQAGFDPYFYRFIHPAPEQPITSSNVIALDRPEDDLSKLCYKFPATALTKEQPFVLGKVLNWYKGITGRGTLVAVARWGAVGDTISARDSVLKLSWQYSTRSHEGDIIARLRIAIPAWSDRLPDLLFSSIPTAPEMDLPRAQIRDALRSEKCTDEALEVDDRSLHAFTINRFKNIWEAENVDEFKRIFLDCLECHYHAWNTGTVLQHNISENNLMIYQPDVTESGALPELEGKAKLVPSRGILNDLDMASEFGSDGQVRLDAHQHHHIAGTLPFMARDLLLHMQVAKGLPSTGKKQKPKNQFKRNVERLPPQHHLYRHDLESFFYILVWATTHYDLKKRERVQPLKDSGLQLWEDPNISNICAAKLYLFESQVGLAPFEDSVLDQWEFGNGMV